MKYGMFESYTEAIGFLVAGAVITGAIVWTIIKIIWVLRELFGG